MGLLIPLRRSLLWTWKWSSFPLLGDTGEGSWVWKKTWVTAQDAGCVTLRKKKPLVSHSNQENRMRYCVYSVLWPLKYKVKAGELLQIQSQHSVLWTLSQPGLRKTLSQKCKNRWKEQNHRKKYYVTGRHYHCDYSGTMCLSLAQVNRPLFLRHLWEQYI